MRVIELVVVLALGLPLAPLVASAQQPGKVRTLGFLSPYSAPSPEERAQGLFRHQRLQRLVTMKFKELGWIEGQSLVIERAFADGREDRLPELAEMLTRRRVDVIWTIGPSAAVAVARATKTIPIVFWGVGSPVEMGLIRVLPGPAATSRVWPSVRASK